MVRLIEDLDVHDATVGERSDAFARPVSLLSEH
jgi:hypothetical protein